MADDNTDYLYLFVYGFLKSDQPGAPLMKDTTHGTAVCIGQGKTKERFPLVVATPWNVAFLLHSPGQGHRIHGEIYRIPANMLPVLDKWERYPDLYVRNQHDVELLGDNGNHGDIFKCWIYQLKSFPKQVIDNCELLKNYDVWEQNSLKSMEEINHTSETYGHLLTSSFVYDALLKASGVTG